MVLNEDKKYTLALEKDEYETATMEFEFKSMTGLYFQMLTVDDLLSEAERALDARNFTKALAYCNRALKLDETRKNSKLLQKIILHHIERKGAKNE